MQPGALYLEAPATCGGRKQSARPFLLQTEPTIWRLFGGCAADWSTWTFDPTRNSSRSFFRWRVYVWFRPAEALLPETAREEFRAVFAGMPLVLPDPAAGYRSPV